MQPQQQPILLRDDTAGVITLTMNRPQQMNLLTSEMIQTLQAAFDSIANDNRARVIVLAAAGKAFCAGHDLKEIRALGEQPKIEKLLHQCSRMMLSITKLPQPVIARVQGVAAAAGCQLVAQCDLAVASDAAKFTTPGVNWGFFCSTPGVAVGRTLPRKRAMEMLLTGDMIDSETALQWALVNRVVPAAQLDAAVAELAKQIAAKPRQTIAAGKRGFYQQLDLSLERAYEFASNILACSFTSDEGKEGMNAFLEKRSPKWNQ